MILAGNIAGRSPQLPIGVRGAETYASANVG
jgi:hypothetical protein